jgi:zinc protease
MPKPFLSPIINIVTMKKLIIAVLFFCAGFLSVKAQSETQSFDADGIKVIFKPTSKKVINVRIYFRGGVTNYAANQAGIEEIALDAATKCGAGKYSTTAFRDTSDKYGILTYGASTYDYGYIQVNCISKYFDKGWDLFSAAVMNPVFEANEVKLLKDKEIDKTKDAESNPENRLDKLQMKNAFSNTPYAIDPAGNEQTVAALTPDDLRQYYKTLLNKNKIFIVVVGKITKQEIFEKVLLSFGNMPSRAYTAADLKIPVLNDNKLLVEQRDLKINYVGAIMNSPSFTNVNYVPFRIGISGLSGNIYYYLRTNGNLSYSAGANTSALLMPYTEMYAATNDVYAVMSAMLKKLKDIQNNGMEDEWLQHIKNTYITWSYINDQSASGITNELGQAEILGGWQYADDLTKLAQMTTTEQVNNAINFYITGLRWTFLGNPEAIEGIKPPAY